MTDQPIKLLLASASPRRRELLALLGLPFKVEKPEVDETPHSEEPPAAFPQRLSREKAAAVAENCVDGYVIAADTIVVYQGEILGKPRDPAEARAMLRRLRGRSHRVLTGQTVYGVSTGKAITDLCESTVQLRAMSDEEIEAYVASGDPLDKAAAYAIQNVEYAPVEQVVGCPANVMGLPMCHVVRALRRHGITLPPTPPTDCRIQFGGYYCEIADTAMPGLTDRGMIPRP